MEYIIVYGTPIIAIFFFVNCVSLAKKIKKGNENTEINTILGAIMFSFIIYCLIGAGFIN
ncbi:hypothetical protein SAMN05880501_1232 [Ureibacillus xyleni]|uniref:Uncharacterized protein n=1 Tax=Ureibacillus xyleni TaxID=614648 RepID=A0A285TUF7_9BACL|nr:hypothetical protein [Ureibacillus xyleni]SOC27521.1 hypothetical protein SAMN05880501_1232 [Ureibacillus xyleni]